MVILLVQREAILRYNAPEKTQKTSKQADIVTHQTVKESTMIDGRQVRAARAILGWSREELLDASGISMSALLRMEGNMADSRSSTLNKVVKALSLAGIEFVTRDDGAIGVILKAQTLPKPPQ
jgi:DNA-binding Xre family transcriptional regulator